VDEITIKLDQDDIEEKTPDEKLNILLKIAFSNHSLLKKHGEVLFGNGKVGLCDTVRTNKLLIKIVMGVIGTAILGFAGVLIRLYERIQ
jgi:hypothetical protein